MKQFIESALIANAASLGLHLINDRELLKSCKADGEILFQVPNKELFEKSNKAFFRYPYAKVGDLSFQGEILHWLYEALSSDKEISRTEYMDLIYQQIKPGGPYKGWVDSFGRKLIINSLLPTVGDPFPPIAQTDKQLVGFVPYLVCKELNKPNDYAWYLAQAFTDDPDYNQFFRAFDQLFIKLRTKSLRQSLEEVISITPYHLQEAIKKGLEFENADEYLAQYAGTEAFLPEAIPLIFHILYHTNSLEEAVEYNILLGGSSADRALLIGAIYSQITKVPAAWRKKVKWLNKNRVN